MFTKIHRMIESFVKIVAVYATLHYVTDFYFRTFHNYFRSSMKVCTKDLYILVN
jgi:hypothetical protein